jgi:hypothetical protein
LGLIATPSGFVPVLQFDPEHAIGVSAPPTPIANGEIEPEPEFET